MKSKTEFFMVAGWAVKVSVLKRIAKKVAKYMAVGVAILAVARWLPYFVMYGLQGYPLIQNAAALVLVAAWWLGMLATTALAILAMYCVFMGFLDLLR